MATTAHEINRFGLTSPLGDDSDSLVNRVDALRLALYNAADDGHKSTLGQFLTLLQ